MAGKQIISVNLERQAHRDAKKRLSLAYAYLIEGSQTESKQMNEQKEENLLSEAKK